MVQPDDIHLLFEWVNDPEVRHNSFCQHEILYKEHEEWFTNMLASDHCDIYIFLVDEKPAGQFRFTFEENEVYFGYCLSKEYRGKGLGTKMVEIALQQVRKSNHPVTKMIARVKYNNVASNKIFQTLGFEEFPCTEYIEYRRNLTN